MRNQPDWPVYDIARSGVIDLTGHGDLVTRTILEGHWHEAVSDGEDRIVSLPVRAVVVDGLGQRVEVGPLSLSPEDARILARSIQVLADLFPIGDEE